MLKEIRSYQQTKVIIIENSKMNIVTIRSQRRENSRELGQHCNSLPDSVGGHTKIRLSFWVLLRRQIRESHRSH